MTCEPWQRSGSNDDDAHPARPLLKALVVTLYLSGNAPTVWLKFAWL